MLKKSGYFGETQGNLTHLWDNFFVKFDGYFVSFTIWSSNTSEINAQRVYLDNGFPTVFDADSEVDNTASLSPQHSWRGNAKHDKKQSKLLNMNKLAKFHGNLR